MPPIRFYISTIVLVLALTFAQGLQQENIQALKRELELSKEDTAKVRLLAEISMELLLTNSNESLNYAQQALAMAEQTGDETALTKALEQITHVTFYNGLYKVSANYMLRLLNAAQNRNDYLQTGRYYFNLGTLKHSLNDLAEAEGYIMRGWKMIDSVYTSRGDTYPKEELATIYNNLAYLKWSMNELEEAEKYYSLGLQVGSKEEITTRNYKNLNLGMANVYLKLGAYDKIEPILNKVLTLQQEENDTSGMIVTYRMEGDLNMQRGLYQEAINYYMTAWSLANSTQNISLNQHIANSLQEIYAKLGVADSTLKYLNLANTFKEQTKANEARQEILRNELLREYESREAKLKEASTSTFRTLTVVIVIILVLTAFSMWLFLQFRRKYRLAEAQRLRIQEAAQQTEQEAEVLKADLERKDKELTTQVIYSIQKNEKISDLVEKLQSRDPEDLASQADELRKIIKALEKTTDKGVWEEFELRFQQVHSGFYERLQKSYPSLTQNERRICGFIRLDMSTKEISSVTGQSVRAIQMARIRLRKKMHLTNSDQALFDVLSAL